MTRLFAPVAAWFASWRGLLAGPFTDHPDIGTDDEPIPYLLDDGLMKIADAVSE